MGHDVFFNDAPITVTVKTDSPNPLKCEMFGEKALKTMTLRDPLINYKGDNLF